MLTTRLGCQELAVSLNVNGSHFHGDYYPGGETDNEQMANHIHVKF